MKIPRSVFSNHLTRPSWAHSEFQFWAIDFYFHLFLVVSVLVVDLFSSTVRAVERVRMQTVKPLIWIIGQVTKCLA
jgi:hypothetical protein